MKKNWSEQPLGNLAKILTGKTPPSGTARLFGGNIPFVCPGDLGKSKEIMSSERTITEEGAKYAPKVPIGSILFSCIGTIGKIGLAKSEMRTNQQINSVIPKGISGGFLYYWLEYHAKKISLLAAKQAVPIITKSRFEAILVNYPPLAEQERIAEILSDADAAIITMERLINAKESRFLLARQNQFLIDYKQKDFLQEVKKILTPVSERKRPDLPLLSTMQNMGVVRRDSLARKVGMTANNTINHKVVCPGDFVVSLQSFKTGLEHSKITGLISPAYDVLRPTKPIIGDYFKYFFKSQGFIKRLAHIAYGIRVGKQISFNSLGEMLVPCPPMNQQKKVAERLNALQKDITLERKVLAALKKQKRGLMQQLLTGKIRVLTKNNKGGTK